MKLHKQLKWLQPYLESVKDILPLKKLNRINLSFYKKNKVPKEDAYCISWDDGTASIVLKMEASHKNKIPFEFHVQDYVLITLAHELTHLIYEDHPPERFQLEALILIQFASTLCRLGYEEARNKVS